MSLLNITKWPSQIIMDGIDKGTFRFAKPSSEGTYICSVKITLGEKETNYPITNPNSDDKFGPFPVDWCNEVTDSTSRLAQVKIVLKKLTVLGIFTKVEEQNRTIKMIVPNSIVPSVSSVTVDRIDGPVPPDWGIYVERFSSAKLTATAASQYGAKIRGYKLQLEGLGLIAGQASNEFTYQCTRAGNLNFAVTATDSRGRTSPPYKVSFRVEPHNRPLIKTIEAYRCDADGAEKGNGTYAYIKLVYSISPIAGHNTATAKALYYKPGTGWTGESNLSNDQSTVVFGALDPNSSQRVKVVVTDALSESDYELDLVSLGSTVEFIYGGDGLSLGKSAELHGYMDCGYKAMFRQGIEFPDTGWKPLKLINGVTVGNFGRIPEYQKLGNIVKIRGDVSNLGAEKQSIELPAEIIPPMNLYFLNSGSVPLLALWRVDKSNQTLTLKWAYNLQNNSENYNASNYIIDCTYLI